MIKWIKPSGVEVETNDHKDNVAMAESLGWKRAGQEQPKRKPGRPARV